MISHSQSPQPGTEPSLHHPEEQHDNALSRFMPFQAEQKALLVLLVLAIALGVSSLANLILLFTNRALATRGKVYVQQPSGFTQVAQEFDQRHREATVIQQTATTWVQLTFEWDNRIPGQPDLTDAGIEVSGETVPTKAYLASYLMQSGFRTQFLATLGREVIPPDVFSGSRKSVVRFYEVSTPRQVAQATWDVDIVATRIERVNTVEDQEIPFNRTITLKAVPPIEAALGEDEPLAWRQRVYELFQNGLLITDVVPLDLRNP